MLKDSIRKLSLSLLITAVASDIVSLLVVIPAAATQNSLVIDLAMAFGMLILFSALYRAAWREGSRDSNRVQYGQMTRCMGKGLICGLLAEIPLIVLYILLLLGRLLQRDTSVLMVLFRFANIQNILLINALAGYPALLFVFCLPIPAVSAIAYVLGYRHISIKGKIYYQKPKASQDKKESSL